MKECPNCGYTDAQDPDEQDRVVAAYREALVELWPFITKAQAEKAIYPSYNDNGGWAPRAYGVISFEVASMPYDMYSARWLDDACRLDRAACQKLGKPNVFQEQINCAIAAIWPA